VTQLAPRRRDNSKTEFVRDAGGSLRRIRLLCEHRRRTQLLEMLSPSELITEEVVAFWPGVKGRLDAVRRIDDHADARDAMQPMRPHDDRIVLGGGAGSWR
jgi:hypothetical protein